MGVLDSVARSVASTLFGKFGQVVKFQERQAGDYDSTAATVSVGKFEHDVSAVIGEFSQNEVHGIVKTGDKKVLVAAKDLPRTPTIEWRVRIGDMWYEIHHVRTTYSGDEAAVHEILARGR